MFYKLSCSKEHRFGLIPILELNQLKLCSAIHVCEQVYFAPMWTKKKPPQSHTPWSTIFASGIRAQSAFWEASRLPVRQSKESPIEDEEHVNQRRAEIGLMRVELNSYLVTQTMPQTCSGRSS